MNTKGYAGWPFEQFLLLIGTFMFMMGIVHTFFRAIPWRVSHWVERGDLDKYITKPVDLLAHITMDCFDDDGILPIFGGIIIVIYSLIKLEIQLTLLQILGYSALMVGGVVLWYAILVMISSVAFVSVKGTGAVSDLLFTLSEFSKFPLPIFGSFITFLMTFILPFGIASYYPSVILLNRLDSIWSLVGVVLSTILEPRANAAR